jgi:hypothetical protein
MDNVEKYFAYPKNIHKAMYFATTNSIKDGDEWHHRLDDDFPDKFDVADYSSFPLFIKQYIYYFY